jgi:hypothetical protein
VAGYLEDLDELVLKCRNKNAREYIRESVASYRAEAYRSAVVSCWVAVCYDLIEKLRELSLAGDKQAEKKIEDLDAIYRDNDTSRALKFEREILDFARDKVELISALEYEDLNRILKDRHRCAHPSLNADGEQYAPPAELARLHIHSAVTHLLQHEPAQGQFALDRILKQLHSEYFPTSRKDVLKVFQNSPIRRARPSLVKNLISVLLKSLFLEEQKDYTTSSKLTSSLTAVCTMHRDLYEARCAEILPDIVSRVEDDNLHHVAKNITRFPRAWESLDHTQQGRLTSYVAKLPTEHFDIIDDILSFSPLKTVAVRRVKIASLNDLESVIPFFTIPNEIIDRSIELYHKAESFNEANKIAAQINLFASDFNDEQVRALLSKLRENDQVMGSFELPKMLEKICETASKHSMDFDELLREHGLEEHCKDTSNQDDKIPF